MNKECAAVGIPECHHAVIEKALALGIPWATIWALFKQFGPTFLTILTTLLGGLVPTTTTPTPTPLAA